MPKQMDEALIVGKMERVAARGRADAKRAGLVAGIGDDAAIWRPRSGFETILTTDWFLEGTHFWREWHPPEAVGWKCLMRAASDIAAMGAVPCCFLCGLALPTRLSDKWLDQFLRGMRRASAKLHCPLAGGDTTHAARLLVNVTIVGEVPRGKALLRSGARPGDLLYVSGRLGEAELGLRMAKKLRRSGRHEHEELLKKHLFPQARIALGSWLRSTAKASAAMDLSDGLCLDLHRLCAASGVGAVIHAEKLPTASSRFTEAFRKVQRAEAALYGGDDYELLFCVPRRLQSRIPDAKTGVKLTQIGEITTSRQVSLITNDGKREKLQPSGWDPFRRRIALP